MLSLPGNHDWEDGFQAGYQQALDDMEGPVRDPKEAARVALEVIARALALQP